MRSSDNLYALNQAMKHLQGGSIRDTFSTWYCRIWYTEGNASKTEKLEHEVEFLFGSNESKVSIPAFTGLKRHPEYSSSIPGLDIKLDERNETLTITGTKQHTSKKYTLIIFLQNATKLNP